MGVYLWTKKLPSTYQEVEYIKSSGRCRIATGFSPSGSYLKTVTKFNLNSFSVERGNTPFIYGYTTSNFCFLCRNGGSGTFEVGNGGGAKVTGVSVSTGTDYEIEIVANSGTQTININGTTESGSCGSYLSTGELQLFCRYGDSIDSPGSEYGYFSTDLTIYSFQIYTSADTCVRDFVPCYRKSDSVIGMYDLVNDVFYTNQGTGTFIKGNDVAGVVENELKNAYIGEYNPWQPGANTVAYYSLENSLNDTSGNNRNLSMYTGSFSYETLSSGKNICRLNTSAQTTNYIMPFDRTAYTVSCYASWDTISSYDQKILFDLASGNNYFPRAYNMGSGGRNIVTGIVSFDDYGANYVQNQWYYIVSVYENDVVKLYINGQFIHSENYSDSSTTGVLSINGISSYNQVYRCAGGLSELIFENKARTSQEISDYFDQTKSNYGIS